MRLHFYVLRWTLGFLLARKSLAEPNASTTIPDLYRRAPDYTNRDEVDAWRQALPRPVEGGDEMDAIVPIPDYIYSDASEMDMDLDEADDIDSEGYESTVGSDYSDHTDKGFSYDSLNTRGGSPSSPEPGVDRNDPDLFDSYADVSGNGNEPARVQEIRDMGWRIIRRIFRISMRKQRGTCRLRERIIMDWIEDAHRLAHELQAARQMYPRDPHIRSLFTAWLGIEFDPSDQGLYQLRQDEMTLESWRALTGRIDFLLQFLDPQTGVERLSGLSKPAIFCGVDFIRRVDVNTVARSASGWEDLTLDWREGLARVRDVLTFADERYHLAYELGKVDKTMSEYRGKQVSESQGEAKPDLSEQYQIGWIKALKSYEFLGTKILCAPGDLVHVGQPFLKFNELMGVVSRRQREIRQAPDWILLCPQIFPTQWPLDENSPVDTRTVWVLGDLLKYPVYPTREDFLAMGSAPSFAPWTPRGATLMIWIMQLALKHPWPAIPCRSPDECLRWTRHVGADQRVMSPWNVYSFALAVFIYRNPPPPPAGQPEKPAFLFGLDASTSQ